MSNWFRGVSIEPVDIKISTVPEGWEPEVMGHFLMTSGPGVSLLGGVTIEPGPKPSPARIRYMFVEEVSKLFMLAQDHGWLDADGKGHGLSLARFLGAQALAANGMGAPDLDLQAANSWMQTTRRDFVNGAGDGGVPDGCRALFLYYLVMQLKFSVDQIVSTGGPTVADATERSRTATRIRSQSSSASSKAGTPAPPPSPTTPTTHGRSDTWPKT